MRFPRKSLLVVALGAVALSGVFEGSNRLFADIQDPPMLKHGALRKLGRGLANITCGVTEVYTSMDQANEDDGNAAFLTSGLVRGVARTLTRFGAGVFDVVTFPFPLAKGSFAPVLKQPIPWVQGGYEEFPPELGFETRFDYCRMQTSSTRMP